MFRLSGLGYPEEDESGLVVRHRAAHDEELILLLRILQSPDREDQELQECIGPAERGHEQGKFH